MIKPTLGRVVWYTPGQDDKTLARDSDGRCAAVVANVWNDRLVNLGGFDANGRPFARTSVLLLQEGDTPPAGGGNGYCQWMPYQAAQAARHAAEDKATLAQQGNLPPKV